MKDLTISIVAYNDEEDIRNVVKSIEEFTNKEISKTIYIIDNSTSPNNIKELTDIYSDVEYLCPKENLGFGRGHNYVLDKLDSKYHAIVNPDILLKEDTFFELVIFMNRENCGMCIPKLTDEAGNLLLVYRRELTLFDMFIRMFIKGGFKKRREYHTMQDMDYSKPFSVPFAQGSFLLIKTDLYKKINGFDDRFFLYLEDADLCKRVNSESVTLYCPYTYAIHKWEKGSHKNPKLFKYHLSSTWKYFSKWGFKIS